MPSLKSHLVAFVLKHTRKTAFATADNMNRWIAASRLRETHRPPAALLRKLSISERSVAGFPVYEVAPREIRSPTRIVYLHGGAYVYQITSYHWRLIAELAERLGAHVTVPIYPIAPEHDFHAIFGMAMATYRGVLDEVAAEDIAFVGDSAGGNMALVLTMMAAREGLPGPGRHVLISPGVDMTLANPQIYEAAKVDPWLGIEGGLEAVRHYCAGIDVADWRISPTYGDLTVLPKTLLLSGTRDILYPDNVRFVEKARAAGVDIELVLEPGMIHVWPLIDMPEARRARDRIVGFLKESNAMAAKPDSLRNPVRAASEPAWSAL
jgi:acetyl esterase/lipase